MFEPTADARMLAKAYWDLYMSLINQGFNEPQAMKLLETMVWSTNIANGMG